MQPYVVAVDIGGTTIKSALVTASGQQLQPQRRATERESGPQAVVAAGLDAVTLAVATGTVQFGGPPSAIGAACLGAVDEQRGIALVSGAVGWRNVPLRELIAERTGLPVALGQDVRAGALAEARYGAGRGRESFLFVAIGTGIGASLVLAGRPYPGSNWSAGELGHLVVDPDGYSCACGGRGCLEAEASGTAISRRYLDAAQRRLTAAEVLAQHRSADPIAGRVWRDTIVALTHGLCAGAAMFDPEVIVIGGGVALAGDELFVPLRAAMRDTFTLGRPPPILPAGVGDSAACLGAGLLAWTLVDSLSAEQR